MAPFFVIDLHEDMRRSEEEEELYLGHCKGVIGRVMA